MVRLSGVYGDLCILCGSLVLTVENICAFSSLIEWDLYNGCVNSIVWLETG